jgi:predicted CxxxxCH...CXXCH cytochrome family protein
VTDGPLHLAYGCEVCHAPVTDVYQQGHFQRDGGAEDGLAEVVLAGTGTWDRSTATCTNSSCHRTAVDTAATRQAPRWTAVGQGEAACGHCHGLPPSTHSPEKNCGLCHPTNATDGGMLRGLHANGTVDIGRALTDGGAPGPATCASCHGDGTSTFADTHGRTDRSLQTVGLHQVHLEGRRRLSAPLACVDCHQQPTALRDVGHLDSAGPAEVFPAVTGVAELARADSAQPTYAVATATCSNVYCHGGGTLAAMDTSPSRVTTLSWTSGLALTCGTCHGAPPNTAAHAGSTTLASCATCHAATVSALGNLVVTQQADGGLATTHLNGRVEKN